MTIQQLRDDTPGVGHRHHFNNAGAALPPAPVLEEVTAFLTREATVGGYEAEEESRGQLGGVYRAAAELVGCQPQEIALTESATRAWDQLFYGLTFRPGDRIITVRNEYASNFLSFLQRAQHSGVEVSILDSNEQGELCLDHLDRLLDDRTRLVAVNHMPTNSGMLQPICEVGERLREHPAFYLVDACQTVGQCPIAVDEIGCDGLTGTSRKYLRGPRGVGFLYARESWIERLQPPFIDLHSADWLEPETFRFQKDARRFEAYESSIASRLGFGRAVRYCLDVGVEWGWERIRGLAALLREGLSGLEGVQLWDRGGESGGIVTFGILGLDPMEVKRSLRQRRINVWTCSERWALLDMQDRGVSEVVRASVHYYNTEDEVAALLEAIDELARGFRPRSG